MKNREKFVKEILDIVCNGDAIAVTKDNQVVNCEDCCCERCLFYKKDTYSGYCDTEEIVKWSESEYIEKPTITSREKKFLDLLLPRWKYIVRDKNTSLYVFTTIPRKATDCWSIKDISSNYCHVFKDLLGEMFNFIKWEDEEPWSIEDLKKLEVRDK